jgi:hypothetical protein
MFKQQTGKYPTLDELNHFKNPNSEFLQPIGLYIVTNHTTWHVMLSDMVVGGLLGTLMDKETFAETNNGIFDDPNPERQNPPAAGKPKLLKFKLIYSIAHLPEGVLQDLLPHFATPADGQEYK